MPIECRNWRKEILSNGYGRIYLGFHKGKIIRELAHRYFYVQNKGPIPEGYVIDHLCRNRKCVNPDHLEAVSHVVNCRRGKQTKLSLAEVDFIRNVKKYTQKKLSSMFRVNQSEISKIINHKRYVTDCR